jgi:Cu-Zn family superoxide dismutase
MKRLSVLWLVVAAVAAGCGTAPAAVPESAPSSEKAMGMAAESMPAEVKDAMSGLPGAVAVMESKSGSALTGTATFVRGEGAQITLTVAVAGVTPGEHAAHIHQNGDCSADDGSSAGGHWNPTTSEHGKWGAEMHHLGDIGNIVVGEDGTGTITLTTEKWTLGDGGPTDVVGKSIIVHTSADDFATQPTGNAGGRIGCGVIKAQ